MMIHLLSAVKKKKKGVVRWLLNEDSTECLGDCLIIFLHGGSILRNNHAKALLSPSGSLCLWASQFTSLTQLWLKLWHTKGSPSCRKTEGLKRKSNSVYHALSECGSWSRWRCAVTIPQASWEEEESKKQTSHLENNHRHTFLQSSPFSRTPSPNTQ